MWPVLVGALSLYGRRRPAWFPAEFDWVIGCSYVGLPGTTQEVRNLFGCNMSFLRELLDRLGGFRLGYGCDETELCIRLGQHWPEKRLLYVPEARVFHHVPQSRSGFPRFVSRCYFEGGSRLSSRVSWEGARVFHLSMNTQEGCSRLEYGAALGACHFTATSMDSGAPQRLSPDLQALLRAT